MPPIIAGLLSCHTPVSLQEHGWHIEVVPSPGVRAASTADGVLVITTSALQQIWQHSKQPIVDLMYVVAHEMGHYLARHGVSADAVLAAMSCHYGCFVFLPHVAAEILTLQPLPLGSSALRGCTTHKCIPQCTCLVRSQNRSLHLPNHALLCIPAARRRHHCSLLCHMAAECHQG